MSSIVEFYEGTSKLDDGTFMFKKIGDICYWNGGLYLIRENPRAAKGHLRISNWHDDQSDLYRFEVKHRRELYIADINTISPDFISETQISTGDPLTVLGIFSRYYNPIGMYRFQLNYNIESDIILPISINIFYYYGPQIFEHFEECMKTLELKYSQDMKDFAKIKFTDDHTFDDINYHYTGPKEGYFYEIYKLKKKYMEDSNMIKRKYIDDYFLLNENYELYVSTIKKKFNEIFVPHSKIIAYKYKEKIRFRTFPFIKL